MSNTKSSGRDLPKLSCVKLLTIISIIVLLAACGAEGTRPVLDAKSTALINEFKQLKSLDKRFEDGNTALHVAAEKNNLAAIRYLLKRGVDVNAKNNSGTTALMMAASYGNDDITALLLKQKATVNETDKYGYTAMFYAVEEKSAAVMTRLVKAGANPNIKAQFGWTVIMVLAGEKDSHLDAIKLFHQKGVKLNASEAQYGLTALAINAMLQGDINVFKYLVDNGADINRIDKVKRTPLIYAMVNKNRIKIDYLLSKGADPRIGLYKGLTPLMFAAARGDSWTVKLLVDKGAQPLFRNKHGKTAIDYARKRRYRGIMSYLKRH